MSALTQHEGNTELWHTVFADGHPVLPRAASCVRHPSPALAVGCCAGEAFMPRSAIPITAMPATGSWMPSRAERKCRCR
jgi:hypothetical protein